MITWISALRLSLLVTAIATLGLQATEQARAQAEPAWRDAAAQCALTLPPGWIMRAAEEIEQVNAQARAMAGNRAPTYATGMVHDSLDGRYALIQVLPVPGPGRYEDIEKAFGLKTKEIEADARNVLGDNVRSLTIGVAHLDRALNRFTLRAALTGPDGVPLQAVSWGHLGKTHIVILHCYAPASTFEASLADFEQLANGIAFDPGAHFVPSALPARLSGVINGALRGALIGGVCGLVVYVVHRLKRVK
jgi:hypothetical protein